MTPSVPKALQGCKLNSIATWRLRPLPEWILLAVLERGVPPRLSHEPYGRPFGLLSLKGTHKQVMLPTGVTMGSFEALGLELVDEASDNFLPVILDEGR